LNTIKIFGIKNCDSVRKAINFFKKSNIEYEFIDLKTTQITSSHIDKWLKSNELSKLFNSKSATFRKMEKKDLSDDEKKEILTTHNLIIKRPVIEAYNDIIIGFDEDIYKEKFK